jgi:hypothetical protein
VHPSFSPLNITAGDPVEMVARGMYVLSLFGLCDAPSETQKGGTVCLGRWVRSAHSWLMATSLEVSRVIGASGIHVRTMCFGKMEGDASYKNRLSCISRTMRMVPTTTRSGEACRRRAYHLGRHERVALAGFLRELGPLKCLIDR